MSNLLKIMYEEVQVDFIVQGQVGLRTRCWTQVRLLHETIQQFQQCQCHFLPMVIYHAQLLVAQWLEHWIQNREVVALVGSNPISAIVSTLQVRQ